jgi:hypothetical protein
MWRGLYLCFYSKEFYRDVAQRWRGSAFLFLLLVVALYCIPLSLTLDSANKRLLNTSGEDIIEQMPVMTFKQGRLSTDKKQPYIVYLPGSGAPRSHPLFIFDNTGKYTTDNLDKNQILITDKMFVMREQNGGYRSVPFDTIPNAVVTHETLEGLADKIRHWFLPFVFFISIIAVFLFRFIQVLIYGLIGLIFNSITGAYLEYSQLVRIAIMAVTPVILIDTLLLLVAPHVSWGLIGFLAAMGYLYFGVRSNRELIT